MPYTDWRKTMAKYEDIVKANATIKMTDVGRGKEYAEVPQRVKAFRMLYPNGSLTSEIISLENGVVIIKATACDENGNVLGTGHAYEKEGNGFINKTSYIENCETSAWGRALAACGIIGGSDESAGSIASAEEVLNAKKQQMEIEEEEKRTKVKKLLEETESDVPKFLEWASEKCMREIKAVDEMRNKELDVMINQLEYTKKNGRKKGSK